MKVSTCVVSSGVAKDVMVTLMFDDCAGSVCFRLDAKSAKGVAEALLKSAAEAGSLLVAPGFDSTQVKGA